MRPNADADAAQRCKVPARAYLWGTPEPPEARVVNAILPRECPVRHQRKDISPYRKFLALQPRHIACGRE